MRPVALLPGLLLALAVAVLGRFLHALLPGAARGLVSEVAFAVLLGLILASAVRLPAVLKPGIRFTLHSVLRLAIVLLGAQFSIQQVLALGGRALILVLILMGVALFVAHALGRLSGVSGKLATLIGVGTAVCGNSAITATAPVIRARDEEVAFAVAVNTLFGTLAVFCYPALGRLLGLSDAAYGTWAGTAVNDTSQVVAAGFAYGDAAGRVATAVKLTRNALMGFVIVAIGAAYSARSGEPGAGAGLGARIRQSVPTFVLGFLALALLHSVGALDGISRAAGTDVAAALGRTARFLILVALAGVGLGTSIGSLRATGSRPLLLGFATAVATSSLSLVLIRALGAAGE